MVDAYYKERGIFRAFGFGEGAGGDRHGLWLDRCACRRLGTLGQTYCRNRTAAGRGSRPVDPDYFTTIALGRGPQQLKSAAAPAFLIPPLGPAGLRHRRARASAAGRIRPAQGARQRLRRHRLIGHLVARSASTRWSYQLARQERPCLTDGDRRQEPGPQADHCARGGRRSQQADTNGLFGIPKRFAGVVGATRRHGVSAGGG